MKKFFLLLFASTVLFAQTFAQDRESSEDRLMQQILWLAATIVTTIIFYHIIRSAVREGIISAKKYDRALIARAKEIKIEDAQNKTQL